MVRTELFSSRRLIRTAIILGGAVSMVSAADTAPSNSPRCIRVSGFFDEQVVTSGCSSAVGLCTGSRYQGDLIADSFFTASTIVPTTDTPDTGVVFATGESILTNARVGGKRGSLTIKNAAVFHTAGDGELLDVQTIVGGSDDLAGATGVIRAVGNFVNGAGRSTFDGSICLP